MQVDLLIQGGTIVSSRGQAQLDIGIRDGKIIALGDLPNAIAAETIDAQNLHILPGVIDTQVHFREPGMEHKEDLESGTRAAICGGVTTIFEMPNTNPATTSKAALEDKLKRAEGRAWCDYAFFVGASTENLDELAELEMLPGTPGIKMFAGSSTGSLLVEIEEHQQRVMQNGRRRMPIHSEDEHRLRERKSLLSDSPHAGEHPFLRDAEAAVISTERMIRLCRETGRPIHILHVSTLEELPLIAGAKLEGLPITCEVTPQHLTLSAPECYERLGTLAQMNPPVRSEEHRQALWNALQTGLFDVLGSDHAPHTLEEKSKPYPASPSGMPGVQTLLPIMLNCVHEGALSLEKFVALASENPALIYGIANKGFIREDYDADLVLVDLKAHWTIEKPWLQSKCGWSPFEGMEIVGRPVMTILRGSVVSKEGVPVATPHGAMARFDWKAQGECTCSCRMRE